MNSSAQIEPSSDLPYRILGELNEKAGKPQEAIIAYTQATLLNEKARYADESGDAYFEALLIPCMKMILRADQNPCRDVAVLRLYIRIHR